MKERKKTNKYISLESLHYHYAPRKLSIWKTCAKEFVSFLKNLDISIISKLVELKKQTSAYSVYNFLPMISKIIGTSILLIVPILTSVTELKTKPVYSILLIILMLDKYTHL